MATNLMPMSDLAIPPGEYLEEVLDSLGMSKDELAQRMGRPSPKLSAIFNGTKAITPETALQLERATGVAARIWSALESEYRLIRARQKWEDERAALKGEERQVNDYGFASLVALGMVSDLQTPKERAEELRRYFGVSALSNIATLRRYEPIFRSRRGRTAADARAMAAWLRYAELKGQQIECAPLDRRALLASLADLRALSCGQPRDYLPALKSALAALGVAFVFIPPGAAQGARGAVFWLGPEKAVILLEDFDLCTDSFWIFVFHALGHVLLHAKEGTIVEWDKPEPQETQREFEAGRFALDTVIELRIYQRFVARGVFTKPSIFQCAAELNVHPALVLCRLQMEGFVGRDTPLNRLLHRVSAPVYVQGAP